MRTIQEKYNAIQEGKFNKSQFLRDVRMELPNLINQFNGFEDTVSILKNKGILHEAEKPAVPEYDKPAAGYSLEALKRGIDFELEKAGIDTATETPSEEQYKKATQKAENNLEKDINFYLNILAGDSKKVDKHDKFIEVKKDNLKDTFNGLKKAEVKEAIDIAAKIFLSEGRKRKMKGGKVVTESDYKSGGYTEAMGPQLEKAVKHLLQVWDDWKQGPATKPEMVPYAKKDLIQYLSSLIKEQEAEMNEYGTSDYINTYEEAVDYAEKMSSKEGVVQHVNELPDGTYKVSNWYDSDSTVASFENGIRINEVKGEGNANAYRNQLKRDLKEQGLSENKNPEFDDLVTRFLKGVAKKYGYSLWDAFNGVRQVMNRLQGKIGQGDIEEQSINEDKQDSIYELNDIMDQLYELSDRAKSILRRDFPGEYTRLDAYGALDFGTSRNRYDVTFEKALETLGSEDEDDDYLQEDHTKNPNDKYVVRPCKNKQEPWAVWEGDVRVKGFADKKEAQAFADKKNKEQGLQETQLKEAVKNIITNVLTEQVITEAATGNLSKLSDDYDNFEGMQSAVNALENVVTDIESYYAKTREKIQGIFDNLKDIKNPDGLNVGAFLAPTIESAFMKDLRPVRDKGFTKGLTLPKVNIIKPGEIAEEELEEKETVFKPVNEGKKYKYTKREK